MAAHEPIRKQLTFFDNEMFFSNTTDPVCDKFRVGYRTAKAIRSRLGFETYPVGSFDQQNEDEADLIIASIAHHAQKVATAGPLRRPTHSVGIDQNGVITHTSIDYNDPNSDRPGIGIWS